MAKFCNKCGKPLVDGKCPDCENKKEEKKEIEVETVENNLLTEYFEILKGMFTHPVATIENYATAKTLPIGIASIIICSILFGIFVEVLLGRIFSSVGLDLSVINTMIEQINALLVKQGITAFSIPSFAGTGIKLILMFGIASVIMAGIIYLMHVVVFKRKLDFKQIIAMIGIVEIPFSVLLLAGMILSFIHYVLGFIVIIFAIIFFLVQFHQGILAISTTNKTQTIYTIALCVGIAIIAFILAFFVVILCAIIAFSIGAYQDAQTAIQSSWGSLGL